MGIRVDQTLHGYAHGHSLLKSSIRLSNEAEHLMLSLSDMSGPGMRSGFESYLTGYPLQKEERYVLARTWYAPEMPRPGCVWTHSLVIRNNDMNRIQDLTVLTRHFRRPAEVGVNEAYTNWLTIDDGESNPVSDLQNTRFLRDESMARSAIWFLYRRPEKPVYLVAARADDYELLVLALWLQQWPRLRQMFSFCTGALASRSLRGKPLDIQVVPKEAVSELRGELAAGNVISPDAPTNAEIADEKWLSAAVQDLLLDWNHRLREVAWNIAGQVLNDRASFPAVYHFARVVEQHQTPFQSANDYIRAIAAIPPGVKIAAALLDAVLGSPDSSPLVTGLAEVDLLRALATEDLSRLRTADLQIAGRVQHLLQADRQGAVQLFSDLISHNGSTESGSEILMEISRGLEPKDIESISRTQPGILSTVVRHKPQLATVSAIWRVSENLQAEIFEALMATRMDPDVLEETIGAALVSQTRVVPERAFQYGDALVEPVCDWLNSNNWHPHQISRAWSPYLRSNVDRVVAWLREHQARPQLLVLVASSLSPDAPSVAKLDLESWRSLLDQLSALEKPDATTVSAFLLALGLRHCEAIAMEFVEESFERVHAVLAESGLDYEYWRPIESIAPPITFWRSWDKCERIRATLLDRYIACDWPPTSLLKAIRTVTTLEQLIAPSWTTKPRERFLKRIAETALNMPLAPEYRKIFESHR